MTQPATITERFRTTREQTEKICEPLETEDYVAQPVVDVSPPRWHLAHTTWFFETFILKPFLPNYQIFDTEYPFLFNSYYVQAGERWQRDKRGALTRPTVKQIFQYRQHVDVHMHDLMNAKFMTDDLAKLIELGINHEEQHQELLLYDIKYILGHNPLFPVYKEKRQVESQESLKGWSRISSGIYQIGYQGEGFCFDNEKGIHNVFLHDFEIANSIVSNASYLEFINNGGYKNSAHWLDEGWKWVQENDIKAPLYWLREKDEWMNYTLSGLEKVNPTEPLMHVSFYEADAFARWAGARLPTEFEWEVACRELTGSPNSVTNFIEDGNFRTVSLPSRGFLGNLWEWTASSYRPYPFFEIADGALGEYNGKFMINQMVLRGGSFGTSKKHIRPSYRNFFHPHLRWMFSGIRLARHI